MSAGSATQHAPSQEEFVQRGRRVTVVTCRHDRELPGEEVINGVRVVRSHVIGRIGKGLVSPRFVHDVLRFGREAPVVNLHLPMIESGLIAKRLGRVPIVVTYHCDIDLPSGPFNAAQRAVMDFSNRFALRRAARTIPTSEDYAAHSRLRAELTGPASHAIPPPTRLRSGGSPSFRDSEGPHIGFLGRLVEEKGVEYLVDAFRALQDADARLLIAGDYRNIAGGSVIEKVRRHMGDDPRIRLLGFLADEQLADFYASLDVFALPSVNAFEAFGIVQVEAMRLGIAALSSDLPGVRQPVRLTGFGAIAAPATRRTSVRSSRPCWRGGWIANRALGEPVGGSIARKSCRPVRTRSGRGLKKRCGSMIVALVEGMRPKQWLKNVLVLAAPLASGAIFRLENLRLIALTFVAFCAASVSDLPVQRHPRSRHRSRALHEAQSPDCVGSTPGAACRRAVCAPRRGRDPRPSGCAGARVDDRHRDLPRHSDRVLPLAQGCRRAGSRGSFQWIPPARDRRRCGIVGAALAVVPSCRCVRFTLHGRRQTLFGEGLGDGG